MSLEFWKCLGWKDLEDNLSPHPKLGRDTFHSTGLFQSHLKGLAHCWGGAATASLGIIPTFWEQDAFILTYTPLLPSGVNLNWHQVWLVFLKAHSSQNRQKTGIKGYPEPRLVPETNQPPRMETNICSKGSSTRPETFLAALWSPK